MQEEVKTVSKRGGARQGAGRKRGENSRNVRASFSLSPLAASNLQQKAEAEGCSRNDFLNRLLEALV